MNKLFCTSTVFLLAATVVLVAGPALDAKAEPQLELRPALASKHLDAPAGTKALDPAMRSDKACVIMTIACNTTVTGVLDTTDCQFFFAHGSFDADSREFHREPGMTIGAYQCRPESRGSIHIKSADPLAPPAITPNFLADAIDQAALAGGLNIARRVGEADALAKYRDFEMYPGKDCRTDDELLDYARQTGSTTYHVMGTCKMGPDSDPLAVVDDRLRVRGLDGLRVVDASVMPTMPSGNINAPVIMVAEKGADMILADRA